MSCRVAYGIRRKQSGWKVTAVRRVSDSEVERWWQWDWKDRADKKKMKAKRRGMRGAAGEKLAPP